MDGALEESNSILQMLFKRIQLMRPNSIEELIRLTEADIAHFESRMREVPPSCQPGDMVALHGEVFSVISYQRDGMPGYWLRSKDEIFLPIDLEGTLLPVTH